MNGKTDRRTVLGMLAASTALSQAPAVHRERRPNVLFLMTDQQRFDTIAALGNGLIYTPNLDRLVRRGVTFTNAYSPCPVCVPARYVIRTGCEPPTTRVFSNGPAKPLPGQAPTMTGRCGPYLGQAMQAAGYRTFGIGKFHTMPWDESIGYDVHLHSEELYATPDQRRRDSFASWIAQKHPAYDFQEGLMGERTEMCFGAVSQGVSKGAAFRWSLPHSLQSHFGRGAGVVRQHSDCGEGAGGGAGEERAA